MAYESLIDSKRPLVFSRYVEIMRAIIDTCEDVKLLVQREIIQQTELSDQVVEDLFNGMRKSIRPTNTLDLEKEIKKVNAKYDDSQKVFPEALTLTTDLYEALLKVIDKGETKQLEKDMLLIGGNANCSPLESKAKEYMEMHNHMLCLELFKTPIREYEKY
ncbi:hypothetical protein JHK87_015812 [Glycine soja]|nr:hypothetical protein JHK87_015812 [Glycine soja]